MALAILALGTVMVCDAMAQEKQEKAMPRMPSVEAYFFDGGQYFQSTTNYVKVDRPADQVFTVLTENGMANWHKYFPGGAGFKRIKGGPQPEMRVGDVLSETLTHEGPPREFHYTVTGLVPNRMMVIEGHVVYKGVVNPKGRWIAVWTFFPEPDGGTTVARYFNALFAATPTYTSLAADHDVMQKMLEKFKRIVGAELPKK
jgi:uncharacterized protein YndB with AHSA1/START domain